MPFPELAKAIDLIAVLHKLVPKGVPYHSSVGANRGTDQRVFVLTLKFFSSKNTVFFPVRNTFQDFFFLSFFLPLF